MTSQSAICDKELSFYRYLAVSERDRDWGLFLTGTGHEVITVVAGASQPDPSAYCLDWSDDELTLTFDPSYPKSRQYEWKKGRKLVDEYGLLYVNGGVPWILETDATNETLQVAAGSVFMLFPGIWHRYRPMLRQDTGFSSTLWCLFGGEFARHWQNKNLFAPQRPVLDIGGDPALEICFRRLHGLAQSGEPVGLQQSLAGAIMELLGKADAADRIEAGPPFSADIIQKARLILEDVTTANIRLERVARLLNLPYGQFRRSFKMATGLSPHQYRMQAIIRQAKEFLQASDLSVTKIAAVLHFSDPYYFAKAFKRMTGKTPSEWRASVKGPNVKDRP